MNKKSYRTDAKQRLNGWNQARIFSQKLHTVVAMAIVMFQDGRYLGLKVYNTKTISVTPKFYFIK